MTFADRLDSAIQSSQSFLVAGCDPTLESLPRYLIERVNGTALSNEEFAYRALTQFYEQTIPQLAGKVAAIKPNVAFFEQYGIGGLRAFESLLALARDNKLLTIIDAKRGDIGSTAAAYAAAYLGISRFEERNFSSLEGDALTVNPFLGFDTLEVFVKRCRDLGKGIFVLVKTSNPGSADLQDVRLEEKNATISTKLADWINAQSEELLGTCGFSGLGSVVGATYPEEARALRVRMPTSIFLIPGFGTQGGNAKDSVAGFAPHPKNRAATKHGRGGALINVSRALLNCLGTEARSDEELHAQLRNKLAQFNAQISAALEEV